MVRKKDVFLIAALLALAAGLLLLLPVLRPTPAAEASLYLCYSVDGEKRTPVALTGDSTLTVDQGEGRVNILRLTAKGFSMASSTCHNQLCVYQGEVTAENMAERPLYHMIVCAPHRLVAELLTAEQLEGEWHAP